MSPVDSSGIMMGPALGAPLQAINMQIWGFGIDGNNSPGLVLLVVTQQNHGWTILMEDWGLDSRQRIRFEHGHGVF
jgi:hypothetical protein